MSASADRQINCFARGVHYRGKATDRVTIEHRARKAKRLNNPARYVASFSDSLDVNVKVVFAGSFKRLTEAF